MFILKRLVIGILLYIEYYLFFAVIYIFEDNKLCLIMTYFFSYNFSFNKNQPVYLFCQDLLRLIVLLLNIDSSIKSIFFSIFQADCVHLYI